LARARHAKTDKSMPKPQGVNALDLHPNDAKPLPQTLGEGACIDDVS